MAVSVLMSVYEKEKPEYFSRALDSIIYQSLQPDEIVLIKDGPLPGYLEDIIQEKMDIYPGFQVYQFEKNVKLGRALAKGVELCHNELIARMDTDDIALNDRLAVQYQYMKENPDVSVCGGWILEFNTEGTYQKIKKMPESKEEIRKYSKYRNPLNHMTVMFRKEEVLKAGNYRHFPFLEDYDLWTRMLALDRKFANIPQVLVKARTEENIYERRGGAGYCDRYMQLRKQQYASGLLRVHEYAVAILLTKIMTLQPSWARKQVYRRLLRK